MQEKNGFPLSLIALNRQLLFLPTFHHHKAVSGTSAHSQKGPRIVLGLIVRAEALFIHNSHLLYSAQYTSYPSGWVRYEVHSKSLHDLQYDEILFPSETV